MEEEVKSRIVLISNKENSSFYVFLGKNMLRDSEESIVFRAQGNAAPISVMAAETLVR
jgi:hypothetical protein